MTVGVSEGRLDRNTYARVWSETCVTEIIVQDYFFTLDPVRIQRYKRFHWSHVTLHDSGMLVVAKPDVNLHVEEKSKKNKL